MLNMEIPLRNCVSSGFTNKFILGIFLANPYKFDKYFDQFTGRTTNARVQEELDATGITKSLGFSD